MRVAEQVERLQREMWDGDTAGAHELIRLSKRVPVDSEILCDAHRAIVLAGFEGGSPKAQQDSVMELGRLRSFDDVMGFAESEIKALEERYCYTCDGTGIYPKGVHCRTCGGHSRTPHKSARFVANALHHAFGFLNKSDYEQPMGQLYIKAVLLWDPAYGGEWLDMKGLAKRRWPHPWTFRYTQLVPECLCEGRGGCIFCGGRFCTMCDFDEDTFTGADGYLDCRGSRYGTCRGGPCERCGGSDKCPRCKHARQ